MAKQFFSRLLETGEFRLSDEGILFYFGEPTYLIPFRSLLHLQRDLEEDLGNEVAKKKFREMGKKQVERALKRYEDRYDLSSLSGQQLSQFIQQLTNVLALGEFELSQFDKEEENVFVVTNKTNPMARIYKKEYGETDEPIDYFIEGLFESGFDLVLEEQIVLEETKCIAKGDDYCQFVAHTTD